MHLSWRKLLEVGIAEIDDDHRQLVDLLNRIQEASADDDRQAALELLYLLKTQVAGHFAREELLMVGLRYAGAEAHRREHGRLFDDVLRQIDDLERGRIVAGAVSVFLQRWLLRHIAGADSELGEALRRHRRQGLAEPTPGGICALPLHAGHGPAPEGSATWR